MTIHRTMKRTALVALCALMAACASTRDKTPPTAEVYNKQLGEADAVWKSGDLDKALPMYRTLADSDPAREEPWSRLAQIEFGREHYGQAIAAAQEALQRDPSDRQAKSVLAVSGLRVAVQSLAELRKDSALAGDATSDAQVLARQLRDTLGEATLFPEEAKEEARPAPKKKVRRRRHVAPARSAADAPAADTPAAAATPPSAGANPFNVLH